MEDVMKNRHFLKALLMLALCLCMAFCFISCGSDDETGNGTPTTGGGNQNGGSGNNNGGNDTPAPVPVTPELTFAPSEDNTYYILASFGGVTSEVITVPATYSGLPVKEIGEKAFNGCTTVKTVVLPESIETIGDLAFANCSSLTSVNIPATVKSVGDDAFVNCDALTYTVEEGAKYLGNEANPYHVLVSATDKNITACKINAATVIIGKEAFLECEALTAVAIPDSVVLVDDKAFASCAKLSEVTLGNGVKSIGDYAFLYCSSLDEIVIPVSVKEIGAYAFSACSGLLTVDVTSAATIGEGAFSDCAALESAYLGNELTAIPKLAFSGCSALVVLDIPATVTSVGEGAFTACEGITYLKDGVFYVGEWVVACDINATSVSLLDGIVGVADKVFTKCASLKSVVIPDSVKYIGEDGFTKCPITDATMPISALSAVSKDNLKNLVLTSGEALADAAFAGYEKLETVSLPDTLMSYGSNVFSDCKELKYYEKDKDLYLGNADNNYLVLVKIGDNTITSFTALDGTRFIANNALFGCKELTTVKISDTVKGIGDSAFANCLKINSLDLGNGVETIGTSAFASVAITTLTIPDSVKTIGASAFSGIGITTLTIPDSVKTIGDGAFANCKELVNVDIRLGIEFVGINAFSGCDKLEYNEKDDTLYLGTASNDYIVLVKAKDVNVTSCVINKYTKVISTNAFLLCMSLKEIVLPESVQFINASAFSGAGLTTIYYTGDKAAFDAITVAETGNETFAKATVYFYSEEEPTEEGNFWHYVDGVAAKWEIAE